MEAAARGAGWRSVQPCSLLGTSEAGPGCRGAADRRDGRSDSGAGRGARPADVLGDQPRRHEEARRLGQATGLPYPRVIPHSDGAGRDRRGRRRRRFAARIGERVWVYGAQSYRPFGTAAQFDGGARPSRRSPCPTRSATRSARAWASPASPPTAPCSPTGRSPARRCSSTACWAASARWRRSLRPGAGATVIGTRAAQQRPRRRRRRRRAPRSRWTRSTPAPTIRRVAPEGVDRIVEVSFSDNADLDAAVAAPEAVIAAYATRDPRPSFDFWPMLFANLTIRLLGSDDFPPAAKQQAAADLTAAAARRSAAHPDRRPAAARPHRRSPRPRRQRDAPTTAPRPPAVGHSRLGRRAKRALVVRSGRFSLAAGNVRIHAIAIVRLRTPRHDPLAKASAVHLASARPRPARAGRSGRGCRRRACRAGGRRGP